MLKIGDWVRTIETKQLCKVVREEWDMEAGRMLVVAFPDILAMAIMGLSAEEALHRSHVARFTPEALYPTRQIA